MGMPLQTIRRLVETIAFCVVIASVQVMFIPSRLMSVTLTYSLSIGVLTWFVIEYGRLVFFHNPETGWPKGVAGPVLVLVACALGFVGGESLAAWVWDRPSVWEQDLTSRNSSLLISLIAGSLASAYFYFKGKSAWLLAAKEQAEKRSAQSQLRLVSAQLQPHMLFNTLANLRALINQDPPKAVAMLDHFNDFLRHTLTANRQTTHTLAQEMDVLRDYTALMAIRFGPRLQVHFSVPEALARVPVLTLLTQALVENAIVHGIEPSLTGGQLWIGAAQKGDLLQITIANSGQALNDGPGERPDNAPGTGVGQQLVRERLASHYGNTASFQLGTEVFQGIACTVARLEFPMAAA
jgi:hypothetical protein